MIVPNTTPGLKSAMVRTVNALQQTGTDMSERQVADLAASFQHTAISQLQDRTARALQWCSEQTSELKKPLTSLVVCG